MIAEFKQALRSLFGPQNRGYSAASVLMLALGIGATTAIFCVLHAVLLAPLPYRDEGSLLAWGQANLDAELPFFSVSGPDFVSWQERSTSFEGLAAYSPSSANVGDPSGYEVAEMGLVTPNFWQVLGQPLLLGRTFAAAEDRAKPNTVVIGAGLWERRYASDPGVLGQQLIVDGNPTTIIGVAPKDAGFSTSTDVWMPLGLQDNPWERGDRRLQVIGRLAEGVTAAAADAQMAEISSHLAAEFPQVNRGWSAVSMPIRDWVVGVSVREQSLTMGAAVLLLLLIACINVGNLQLARATTRAREIGVRQALGATRARLMRQILGECLVLAALGGVLGMAIAAVGIKLAALGLATDSAQLRHLDFAWPVALAALALTTLSALLCGLAPAWVAVRAQIGSTLQVSGRSSTESQRTPLRQGLVVVQFALATLLLVGSALLVQNFRALQTADLGFSTDRLLTARLTLPDDDNGSNYRANAQRYRELMDALRALPGVEQVGLGSDIPLGDYNDTSMQIIAGTSVSQARESGISAPWRVVTAEFLSALQVPLLRGRMFMGDNESGRSMLLSQSLARRLWPDGEDPIGQTVTLTNTQQYTVVGIVGDVNHRDHAESGAPTMYMSNRWAMLSTMTLALRTQGDPAGLIATVRETASAVLPEYPLFDIATMSSVAEADLAGRRQQTAVVSLFGLVSLLLAAVGIAGVTAFLVARRTPELAVRLALGATPRRIVRHVVARAGTLCVLGVALGITLAALALPHLQAHLGAPIDGNITLVAVAGMLATVGLLACWIPARRASRIDPRSALGG